MDKTIRRAGSFEEQKAEEYRYWQSLSISERTNATWQLSFEEYKSRGLIQDGDRLQRALISLERKALHRESTLMMRKSKV